MSDLKDLAASLPVPGKDPKPPAHGALTKEEVKKIRAEKRGKSRRKWSNPAEAMMGRILKGAFGARNVTPAIDRQQAWQDSDRQWHRNWANRGKPDWSFAIIWNGELVDGVMEVKCVSPTSTGLSVDLSNIKPEQIEALAKMKDRGGVALWGLVFWEGVGKARCFVVEHDHFMNIIREELPSRAKGSYKGRSLRKGSDLDLLHDCEVLKTNRWFLPIGHWARSSANIKRKG